MGTYVPLLQTLAWVGLIAGVLVAFRRPLRAVVGAVGQRVSGGADLKVGVAGFQLELGRELPRLPSDEEAGQRRPDAPSARARTAEEAAAGAPPAWTRERDLLKADARGVHLAHVIARSAMPGQLYDVFVYLVESRDAGGLAQVRRAEFFLGRHWGNRVFEVPNNGERIGFSTSAYGPALCLCRVEFTDGHNVVLNRYLDFESGPLLARPAPETVS